MNKPTAISLSALKKKLEVLEKKPIQKKVLVGFDGFVDKIKKAVKLKHGTNEPEYFKTLSEFADRIHTASGKSGQVEMVTQKTKLGGNAPILANALGRLYIKNICIGCLGLPNKKQVFSKMNPNCELLSVLDPGLSDAIEFSDGKMIFSELNVFESYNWKYVKGVIDVNRLIKLVKSCSLLAFVDWANLPWAYDIWCGMLQDVIKRTGRKDFHFLFDLCDPSKRSTEDIDEILDLISSFSTYGKVTLCLNENEALSIWASLHGHDFTKSKDHEKLPDVRIAGSYIFSTMTIEHLLVHPMDRTILFSHPTTIEFKGMVVTDPKVLTGGGDNFNAGYCLGILAGFEITECILMAMAGAGSYIRNGSSPTIRDIIEYLNEWEKVIAKAQLILAN